MVGLLGEGKALLFYSSETEETAHLCHRVIVMREGRGVAELAGAEADAEALVAAVAEGACSRLAPTPYRSRSRWQHRLVQSAPLLLSLLILAGTLVVYIAPVRRPTCIVSPATSSGRR